MDIVVALAVHGKMILGVYKPSPGRSRGNLCELHKGHATGHEDQCRRTNLRGNMDKAHGLGLAAQGALQELSMA